jgi:tetratricopeptide (TPR) repeat protein
MDKIKMFIRGGVKRSYKLVINSLLLIVLALVFQSSWAQQDSSIQPSEQIITAITSGNWNLVRTESIAWAKKDQRSGIALFLADITTSVTHNFDTKFVTLMKYDYPYNDRTATAQISDWIESILKTDEKNVNFLILKAALQVKAYENMDKANQLFEKARELSPDNEYILINLGNGYGSKNRTAEARELFDKVLKQNPSSAGALNGIGMLAMSRQDMKEAEKMFAKAVKAKGAGPMEWFNLGSAYSYQKKSKEAARALEKAIALSPKMIDARFNLAATYYAMGKKQACIEQLKKIVEIDPSSQTGTRARNNLRSLGQ